MLRLVSISQYKRKIWSNQELHFIDHNLLLKKDIEINLCGTNRIQLFQ